MGLFLANPCPSTVQILNLEVLDQGMSHAKELSGLPIIVSTATHQDSVDKEKSKQKHKYTGGDGKFSIAAVKGTAIKMVLGK